MSLPFFADQCVPTSMIDGFVGQGHDVTRLRSVMPVNSPDPLVIAKAQDLGCILLSLNGDFSDIVAYPPSAYGGIIAFQLHNHPEVIPQVLERCLAYVAAHTNVADYRGRLLIVEPHRIRIRT